MEDFVEKYAKYLRDIKGASENTILSYQRDLKQFISFLKKVGIKEIQKVNRTNIVAYLLELQKKEGHHRQFLEILFPFVLFSIFVKNAYC